MDSGDVRERHIQALKLSFDGDHDASLRALESLHMDFPDDVEVLFDLAMLQMMLGKFEEACTNLKSVLVREPKHVKALQQVTYC